MIRYIAILISLTFAAFASAQESPEQQVRAAEASQVKAVLAEDIPSLSKLWSPALVVNSPGNSVATRPQVFDFIHAGALKYTAYEQTIESVTVSQNTVFVMGQEMVKPVNTRFAGKTVQRRFTDAWQLLEGSWVQVARQATVISAN